MAMLTQRRLHKVEKFGLEVPNGVMYHSWEPGKEYTKTILLKNIKIKTQKIKFKVSSSNFFSAVYPQPIVLSAGNSYSLPITFRPQEKNNYEDCIEFQTSEGTFAVPLIASIPQPNLTIPDQLQFGLCAVSDIIAMDISVTNTGPVSTEFHWECTLPFKIDPPSGTLNSKDSCKFKVSFSPSSASVYCVIAICHYGEKYHISKTMKLQASGKYPHLSVKVDAISDKNGVLNINFGDVPVGVTAEKALEIHNATPVSASFLLEPETVSQLNDNIFIFTQHKGIIPPLDTITAKVLYTPLYNEQPSTVHYNLSTKGGLSTIRLTCTGKPTGPNVIIDEEYLSFGIIECGQTTSAVIHIRNLSKTSTIYQILLGSDGVFHTDTPSGEIGGGSTCVITIHFSPIRPIPYHKMITCLLLDQEPLSFHVIGSAYTEKIRPVQLNYNHIKSYRSAAYSGLSKLSPEYLQQCITNGSLIVSDDGSLLLTEIFESTLRHLGPLIEYKPPSSAYMRYVCGEIDPYKSCHVTIDQEYLDFGYTAYGRSSEKKFITVTNHTEGTLYCSWMSERGSIFQVVPIEREIPSNSTVAFTVTFWPNKLNHLYSKQIECYLFHKILRDYSLVDSNVVILPWCLQVTALGHSFSSGVEPFLPTLSFNNRNVVFPSTVEGQSTYRTLVGKNCGESPVMFQFAPDPSGLFQIKPQCGIVTADTYQLFIVSMSPKHSQLYEHILECTMNNCSDFKQELLVSGLAEIPNIQIKGKIYFKPTPVGGYSIARATITNPCGLPIKFFWQFKDDDSDIVSIVPSSGTLTSQESIEIIFKFTPQEEKHYSLKGLITTFFKDCNIEKSSQRNKTIVMLAGKGTSGKINCPVSHVDCGPVTIGISLHKSVKLSNDSNCTLRFKLGVSQTLEAEDGTKEEISIGNHPHGLQLSISEMELNAYSKKAVKLSFRPSFPSIIQSELHYQLITPNKTAQMPWEHLCDISIRAVYPTLSILNVQGDGMAASLSKSQIWKMLQIDKINHFLKQDPTPEELRYDISTRHSVTRKIPILTRAIVDFNFGAAPLNKNKESVFYFLLTNASPTPTQWAFQFPMDMYLEPPYWSETGNLSAAEQHELDVVNNGVFSVHPKQGRLGIGEKVVVKCSYQHSHLGTSYLPVLLKINRGREIMLNFIGLTSPVQNPCVAPLSSVHTFDPVLVNVQCYPIQYFELTNSGDTEGTYYIDTAPLDDLTKSNYDICILKCLEPQGELASRQTNLIPFIFSPTEAKIYSVDLSIYFSNGDVSVVTFQGEGHVPDNNEYISLECDTLDIPEHSELVLPGQFIELSQERINLGHIPLFAVVRRLIFLRNISRFTTSFHWQLEKHYANNVVSIHPESGYLQPNQVVACRVTFHSLVSPTIYDINISCQIVNESEMAIYTKNLEKWEKDEEYKKVCFAIVDPQKKSNTKPQLSASKDEETYEKWKKKDLSVKSKTRARPKYITQELKPLPPLSQYIQFSITAQTHSIPDYCKHFNNFGSYSIDYQPLLAGSSAKVNVIVNQDEKMMMCSAMGEILRELLTDSNFLKSVQCVTKEPVPYFVQISSNYRPSSVIPFNETAITTDDRHVHSSGTPSVVESNSHRCDSSKTSLPQTADDKSEQTESSEISIGLPEPPQPLSAVTPADKLGYKIKHHPEFHSLSEKLTENILLNIIRESLAEELKLTAPLFTIAKPPQK